ncbi:hypothetical protein [Methanocella conradii]|uniref:hypothetical protein n=1 Tax=Methanocella conradii TaxID=1175444 RepID=UPI00157C84FD|nr:hypothetical protein [Methanocella conradii]
MVALMLLLPVTVVPTISASPKNNQAILIQGIEDYLTGKIDKLPAYNEYPGSGAVDINYTEKRHAPMPLPLISDNISISSASLNGITSIPSRSVYDPHWSNTYIMFGGPDVGGPTAWFVDGVVDWCNNIEDNFKEELVMHQYGTDAPGAENCIQLLRSGNTVWFNFYCGAKNPATQYQYSYPSSHTFMLFVKPILIDDNGHYNSVEYCVYDLTSRTASDKIITLPQTQTCVQVDVALEKYYENGEARPGIVNAWKYIYDFHAYNLQGSQMNLRNSEHLFFFYTDNVANAHYEDFYGSTYYYGSLYITRCSPNSYPPHP